MAVVIAKQRMTVRTAEGEHNIFPSARSQSLPDDLLKHDFVKGAIKSGWIVVQSVQAAVEPNQEQPVELELAPSPGKKKKA